MRHVAVGQPLWSERSMSWVSQWAVPHSAERSNCSLSTTAPTWLWIAGTSHGKCCICCNFFLECFYPLYLSIIRSVWFRCVILVKICICFKKTIAYGDMMEKNVILCRPLRPAYLFWVTASPGRESLIKVTFFGTRRVWIEWEKRDPREWYCPGRRVKQMA